MWDLLKFGLGCFVAIASLLLLRAAPAVTSRLGATGDLARFRPSAASCRLPRMRRILVIGLVALVPAFFSAAGRSHVHRSAHPHADPRVFHHGHLGHADHGLRVAAGRGSPAVDLGRSDAHDGDAIYVADPPNRAGTRAGVPVPAIGRIDLVTDRRLSGSEFARAGSSRPRDPPDAPPPGLRAPPA